LEQSYGAVIVHSDYRIVYANDDACRLAGAKDHEDLLGKPILDMIHSDNKDIVKKRIGRIYESEDVAPIAEEKMVRLDGSIIDIEVVTVGFKHEGRPAVLMAFKDISDRKHTVGALGENERFLQAVFDSIQDGISVFDKDFTIVRADRTMERWHADKLPLVGKKCYDAYHGRTEPCEYCPSLTAITENRKTVNIIPRDGPVTGWQEVYAFPVIDEKGMVKGAIHYVRDITDRKKMEDALRESEEKFRVLADTSPVAIVLHEGDKVIYINPAGERIIGYSKEEIYGMNIWSVAHPDQRAQAREAWNDLVSGKASQVSREFRVKRKDGAERWVKVSAGMAELAGKNITILSVDDITGRKQAEEALEESKSEAELYVDLMGHDINNMNQIGMGFLEIALGTLDLDEPGRALLTKSLGALEGSTRLIDNVRKIQRAESGDMRNYPVDLDSILARAKDSYSHVPGTDVDIHYTPAYHCDVMANELLYDVFANLVGNSIKHASEKPVIDITVRKAYDNGRLFYKVVVEDNGPGIPDEIKPVLFTKNLRGTHKIKGSGLGLYLVRTLVKSYNGRVWAEDRVQGDRSKGSRFVVMLPGL
jgi:PAS domain S-box-containing protein